MLPTLRYILLTAVRDWLFIALFAVMFFAIVIATFLGGTALVEQEQMVISYIAGSTRVILQIGLVVFVCFHVRRAFENREVEVILSRPISRAGFVISYWFGFAMLSALLVLPLGVYLALSLNEINFYGLLNWSVSLLLESVLVIAFSLSAALILRSAVTAVLGTFCFYVISRLMGFMIFMIDKPYLFDQEGFKFYTSMALYFFSMAIPRLDLYTETNWLIYGLADDITDWVFLPQTLIFAPLLLAMAIVDFRRKQF